MESMVITKKTISDNFVALLSYLLKYISLSFRIIFLYATDNPTLEYHLNKFTNNVPTQIYPHKNTSSIVRRIKKTVTTAFV